MYMFMFITSIYYSAVQCINIDRLDLSDYNFYPFQVFFYSRGLNVFFLKSMHHLPYSKANIFCWLLETWKWIVFISWKYQEIRTNLGQDVGINPTHLQQITVNLSTDLSFLNGNYCFFPAIYSRMQLYPEWCKQCFLSTPIADEKCLLLHSYIS